MAKTPQPKRQDTGCLVMLALLIGGLFAPVLFWAF